MLSTGNDFPPVPPESFLDSAKNVLKRLQHGCQNVPEETQRTVRDIMVAKDEPSIYILLEENCTIEKHSVDSLLACFPGDLVPMASVGQGLPPYHLDHNDAI